MGSFKDVVGHKDIINYIRNAVREDKVSHAYILNGERGAGKKMLANLFAATLLCEKGGPDPCNECHSCRQAESGNHPDIIKVTHEKPNSISVDDIREQVNNTIMIKPYQGPYKVYIIPQADMMTPHLVSKLRRSVKVPLICKPNAGIPTINDQGVAEYAQTPEEFTDIMLQCRDNGAALLGGCCGTTPAFIAALAKSL